MSKQKSIILILVIFIVVLGVFVWYYFSLNGFQPAQTSTSSTSTTDIYDPFGTRVADNNPPASTTNTDISGTAQIEPGTLGKLRQISEEPISGFSVTEDAKAQKTDIHYILRANGNIYEAYTDSPELKRLSITTIPKVYESQWLPDGIHLIIKYLRENTENIETFSVKINPATSTLNEFEGGVDGNHLPENISTLAINPKGDKIFYLTSGLTGSSGYISKPDGLNKKLLFGSPLTEWLVSWPKEEILTFNTKPSANIPGYLYFLNSLTGNFSRVLGDINGLTTKTNKTATAVLYSDNIRTVPKLYLFDIKKRESKLLPWNTFPEKCLWSNLDEKIIYCAVPKTFPAGNNYPDSWYQGVVGFADTLWMMNTETGATTLVFDFEKEAGRSIDMTDLALDSQDSFLYFTNKTDLTFWSLNLK